MLSSTLFSLVIAIAVIWASHPIALASQSTPVPAGPEVTFAETECAYELPDGFEAGDNAVCGTVTAPLYYDRDTDETVTLPVIQLRSTSDSPVNPPLVMLQGGPGQTMDSVLREFRGESQVSPPMLERQALLESQDVILFDQRGMGLSTPSLICPAERQVPAASPEAASEADATPADPGEQFFQQLQACKDDLQAEGVQFDAFTVGNSAADVDAVRVALGLDEIDLWGSSYGSRLLMEYLRDHSSVVRATVIASPSPPDRLVMMEEQYIGISDSLRLIFDNCADEPECREANPDLETNLERAFESMNESPLTIEIQDPVTGSTTEMPMDGYGFAQLLQNALWIGPAIPLIPSLITSAADGDASVIEEIITIQPFDPVSLGITFTLLCQDVIPFRSHEEVQSGIEQADLLPFVASDAISGTEVLLYPGCEVWNIEASDPATLEPVFSDVPTLILSGRYDPITPPDHGEGLLETFPNAEHVIIENASHGPSPASGSCPSDLMDQFLADPASPLDTSCAETPVDFSGG